MAALETRIAALEADFARRQAEVRAQMAALETRNAEMQALPQVTGIVLGGAEGEGVEVDTVARRQRPLLGLGRQGQRRGLTVQALLRGEANPANINWQRQWWAEQRDLLFGDLLGRPPSNNRMNLYVEQVLKPAHTKRLIAQLKCDTALLFHKSMDRATSFILACKVVRMLFD